MVTLFLLSFFPSHPGFSYSSFNSWIPFSSSVYLSCFQYLSPYVPLYPLYMNAFSQPSSATQCSALLRNFKILQAIRSWWHSGLCGTLQLGCCRFEPEIVVIFKTFFSLPIQVMTMLHNTDELMNYSWLHTIIVVVSHRRRCYWHTRSLSCWLYS